MTDWQGTLFSGISLTWDYEHRHVTLSMPGYVKKLLHKFNNPTSAMAEDSPHKWHKPKYESPNIISEDKSENLTNKK